MGENHDPSMEEILASIKRVMEDEAEPGPRAGRSRRSSSTADDVLELSDTAEADEALISSEAADASRSRLARLSAAKADGVPAEGPLEAVVREMLKPMLKDWLDANLPGIVEELVQREIKRISGKPV